MKDSKTNRQEENQQAKQKNELNDIDSLAYVSGTVLVSEARQLECGGAFVAPGAAEQRAEDLSISGIQTLEARRAGRGRQDKTYASGVRAACARKQASGVS